MVRGTFANIRLEQADAPGTEGGVLGAFSRWRRRCRFSTPPRNTGKKASPLIVLAGREYGSGSSRDWAAKGPAKLLGIRAVIAESYERLHRSEPDQAGGILPLRSSR